MNDKIDIVVTYLNDQDQQWQEEFNKYKQYEVSKGWINPDSIQAFGEERIRNWDFTQYWFRGVEKCCPWVNKIFFIIQNGHHIPEWLNTTNPKIRIVYHNEFIPKELLPTFNATTIGLYINQIKDLSDNYIMCDDDYFFLNPIDETKFFIKNKPQHEDNQVPYGYFYDGDEFLHIMNNCFDFEKKYDDGKTKYHFYHLPTARNKILEQKILKDNYNDILNSQRVSRFRYPTNLDANIYSNILKLTHNADILPKNTIYGNSAYVALQPNIDFYQYKDKEMVCFNDVDLVTGHFKEIQKSLIEFLKYKFPNKSSFEV